MKSLALQDFRGAKGSQRCCRLGRDAAHAMVRRSCRDELGTCSMQAGSCVQSAHCLPVSMDLWEVSLRGYRTFLVSLHPPGRATQMGPSTWAGLMPCQPAASPGSAQDGGCWQGPEDGGLLAVTDTCWGVGWEHR